MFRRHLDWFEANAVRVVPLAEIVRLAPDAEAVAITFDDGFANVLDLAAPVLAERGLPATMFVVSGRVGKSNQWNVSGDRAVPIMPLLDWAGLKELVAMGFSLGAHTVSHPRLGRLPPEQQTAELTRCVEQIGEQLGERVVAFAYPYGQYTEATVAAARSRFEFACTTELRALRPVEDMALLPRIDMYYFRKADALSPWGSARFRWRLGLRARARRTREGMLSLVGGL